MDFANNISTAIEREINIYKNSNIRSSIDFKIINSKSAGQKVN